MRASPILALFAALTTAQVVQPSEDGDSNGSLQGSSDDDNGSFDTTDPSAALMSLASAASSASLTDASALFSAYSAAASSVSVAVISATTVQVTASASSTAQSTSASIPFGSTLSNGAYVCNPAHSYPAGASCNASGATPSLVAVSTTISSSISFTSLTATSVTSVTSISTVPTNSASFAVWASAGNYSMPSSPIATFTGAGVMNAPGGLIELAIAGILGFVASF